MRYDAIIIGGGISGLTAASLLAKKKLKVAVVDKGYSPGGSCGVFKRGSATFDIGAAMLYGFGSSGFNAHRFVFNCLEEPIDIIEHDLLYTVVFNGIRIPFWRDIDRFVDELAKVFPSEAKDIHRFYRDMSKLYQHVMVESPNYCTPDETDPIEGLKKLLKHPISYVKFLSYLNKSAKSLLQKYFTDPEIFNFFDKLTSTYCYATVEEAPAILAAVMFVDNHIGGSYYPAGSTLFLPGKLEKVIEENNGEMIPEREVTSILFEDQKPVGVQLDDGRQLFASNIVYSGTVWNLYQKLIDPLHSTPAERAWAVSLQPTYPSVIFYSVVDKAVIPEDTTPIEMLVGNPSELDESEVTAYILSIDDQTLCAEDEHIVIAIGPTFKDWNHSDPAEYRNMKIEEKARLFGVLEKRFPGFSSAVRYTEIATPKTIERYTLKNGGAVAGPKQMLGQHMFKRLHTKSKWDNLFYCGESTVMGTGTPTVTTSGLSAANAVLKKLGLQPYVFQEDMKNYVTIVEKPFTRQMLYENYPENEKRTLRLAKECRFCEQPSCTQNSQTDIRGIMRRVAVGNFVGAKKAWKNMPASTSELERFEQRCICTIEEGEAVQIKEVVAFLETIA